MPGHSTPRDVLLEFQTSLQHLDAYYNELILAVHGKRRQAILESILAEQFCLALGVRWEGFIHDLFVAYLRQNAATFLRSKVRAIRQSIEDKFGSACSQAVKVNLSFPLSTDATESLLDPKRRNVEVSSADDLSNKAKLWSGPAAKKFALEQDDRDLVDLVIALRNYLAHKSRSARRELSVKVGRIGRIGPNSGLACHPLGPVPVYLKRTAGGRTRTNLLYTRILQVASKLA